jgi:hypothetical protein
MAHRLTKCVEDLTSRNRKLRRLHIGISDTVVQIMNGDLLNKSDDW